MNISRIKGITKYNIGEPTKFRGLDGKYAVSGISDSGHVIEIGEDWVPGLQIDEDSGFIVRNGKKSYIDSGEFLGSNHDITEIDYKKILDLAKDLPENIWLKS